MCHPSLRTDKECGGPPLSHRPVPASSDASCLLLSCCVMCQDVEYLVEQRLGDVLKPGCSAAFAFATQVQSPHLLEPVPYGSRRRLSDGLTAGQGEEGVGYVAEVRDGKAPAEGYDPIIRRIRQVVAEAFEVRHPP